MDERGANLPVGRSPSMRTLEARKVLPAFAIVLVVGVAAAVDVFLVRVAARHRAETGVRLFEKGLEARAHGDTAAALELLRSAHNRVPGDSAYHLAFAQALIESGRLREGHAALSELLNRHPADGAANAEMARALARSGNWQDAAWFYHRAIYGEWRGTANLRELRFELAELLAVHGAREQLVSEVVLLSTEPASEAEARRLGRLQLAAGEWRRAELLFRSLLRTDAVDPEVLTGLAKAQMGQGRYLAAERTLRRAIAAGAPEERVRQDLEEVATVNSLDPTIRGLDAREKHRRAHTIAEQLLRSLQACAPDDRELAGMVRRMGSHTRSRDELRNAENDLEMLETLWTLRHQVCKTPVALPPYLELLVPELTK